MKTKMRPRYYCDHCGKGSGNPSHMRRHERGCTLNPDRVCGMCAMKGRRGNLSINELVAVLDENGFAALREEVDDCPACILAALRTKNDVDTETGAYIVHGPRDGRESWSWAQAKKDWFDAWSEDKEDCY